MLNILRAASSGLRREDYQTTDTVISPHFSTLTSGTACPGRWRRGPPARRGPGSSPARWPGRACLCSTEPRPPRTRPSCPPRTCAAHTTVRTVAKLSTSAGSWSHPGSSGEGGHRVLGGRVGWRGVHVALARDPARGGHVDDDAAAAPRLAGHVPRAGLEAAVDPLLQPGPESQCRVG